MLLELSIVYCVGAYLHIFWIKVVHSITDEQTCVISSLYVHGLQTRIDDSTVLYLSHNFEFSIIRITKFLVLSIVF